MTGRGNSCGTYRNSNQIQDARARRRHDCRRLVGTNIEDNCELATRRVDIGRQLRDQDIREHEATGPTCGGCIARTRIDVDSVAMREVGWRMHRFDGHGDQPGVDVTGSDG